MRASSRLRRLGKRSRPAHSSRPNGLRGAGPRVVGVAAVAGSKRAANVRNRLRSTTRNRSARGRPQSRMNRAIPPESSLIVVTLEPACHAGGRGFESRRSRPCTSRLPWVHEGSEFLRALGVSRGHGRLRSRGGKPIVGGRGAGSYRRGDRFAFASDGPRHRGAARAWLGEHVARNATCRWDGRRPGNRLTDLLRVSPLLRRLHRQCRCRCRDLRRPRVTHHVWDARKVRVAAGDGQGPHASNRPTRQRAPRARRGARARPPEVGEALQSPDRCSVRGGSDADRPPRPPVHGGEHSSTTPQSGGMARANRGIRSATRSRYPCASFTSPAMPLSRTCWAVSSSQRVYFASARDTH